MTRLPPLSLPALLVCLVASGACSTSATDHLDRATAHLQQGNHAAAVLELRNAVKADPKLAAAHVKLGEIYFEQGAIAEALGAYVRAADLLPADYDVQMKAGGLLLLAGQPQEALTRADKALGLRSKDPDALVLRANALAGLTDFDGAVKQVQEAIALDPTAVRQTNLGVLQMAQGRREEAEAAFREAVRIDPKAVDAQLSLANFLWATGRTDEAESALKAALSIDSGHLAANRALAALYLASGRGDQAEAYFKKVADSGADPGDRLALADYYVSALRSADAVGVLDQLSQSPATWALARSRTAALLFADGKKDDAYRAIDEVIAKQPAYAMAQVTRSRFLMADGRPDDALAVVQQALKADTRNVEAHYLLGSIQTARRQFDEAAAAFQEVLRLNPRATVAQLQLAQVELQRGGLAAATQLAEQAAQREPSSLQPRLVLARTLMARGDLDRATGVTLELLAAFPDVGAVHVQAGMLALRKRDLAMARTELERALVLTPALVEPLMALASMDVAQGQGQRARTRFEERLQKTPHDSALLLAAASTWVSTGDPKKGEELLRRAIEADGSNFDAYAHLAQLLASQGRLDEARVEYDRLAERQPTAVGPQTLAALIVQAQGKTDEARQRFERLVERSPRAAVAANNLAYLYVSQGEQLDRALELAQAAKAELPDHPEVNDTLALVYLKRRLPALAVPLLRLAIEKEPANPSFLYHLGLAYSDAGDKQAAREVLEQALRIKADFDGADDARRVLHSVS